MAKTKKHPLTMKTEGAEMPVRCLYDKLVELPHLKPHPQNRNTHPADQIQRLAEILRYQGWRYPVKVSKRSGFVTAGHGRIEAAKVNGWGKVPVNFQDYESEEQEYADVVADNAIASWADLDLSGIHADLPGLAPFDLDMLGIKDSTAKAKAGTQGSKWSNVQGDDKPFDPSHILDFFSQVSEVFLWGGDYYCDKLPIGTFIVWDKNNGNESADNMIGNAYELCWSKQKHKRVMARIFGRGTFGHDKVKVHPTQKPAQLAEWFWERWGKDAKLIWDGYLGSGSTLIACEKTGRRCYGMEIEPLYGDVILDRWAKFTGRDPVREDGAKWSEVKNAAP